MQNQKTAAAPLQGARLYFPGYFPKGNAPYVELGTGSRPLPTDRRWIIPRPICNALWALMFGFPPKQSTSRRR